MKKFVVIIISMMLLLLLSACSLARNSPEEALSKTIDFVFFGKDDEQVKEAYGFNFNADEVYVSIYPDATDADKELYAACQEAIKDVVEYETEVISEDDENAVIELTVIPLDIIDVMNSAIKISLDPDFSTLSEEEKNNEITEEYFLALEDAKTGEEQTFEVEMVKKEDFWVIKDVDSIQELNSLFTTYLTNITSMGPENSDEGDGSGETNDGVENRETSDGNGN